MPEPAPEPSPEPEQPPLTKAERKKVVMLQSELQLADEDGVKQRAAGAGVEPKRFNAAMAAAGSGIRALDLVMVLILAAEGESAAAAALQAEINAIRLLKKMHMTHEHHDPVRRLMQKELQRPQPQPQPQPEPEPEPEPEQPPESPMPSPSDHPREWEIFCRLDADGSGTLDTEELFEYIADQDERVADELMAQLDQNGDGEVDFRCAPTAACSAHRHRPVNPAGLLSRREFVQGWALLFGKEQPGTVADVKSVVKQRVADGDISPSKQPAASEAAEGEDGEEEEDDDDKEEDAVDVSWALGDDGTPATLISEVFEKIEASAYRPLEVFFRFDSDGSGEMDFQEFVGAMEAMQIELPPWLAKEAFEELDEDGSGAIEIQEMMTRMHKELKRKQQIATSTGSFSETAQARAMGTTRHLATITRDVEQAAAIREAASSVWEAATERAEHGGTLCAATQPRPRPSVLRCLLGF